ncbi:dihydrofolate reductase, partial [Clostridioides difficile]
LTKERLEKVSQEVTIIDIASSPGGVDYSVVKEAGINATLCLGLPGKYSPKTSGEILVNAIRKYYK